MGSRDTYRRNTKNTSVSQNIHQTNPSGTISTSQHFKVNNRSSDKHASAQSNPANRKPFNKVISEPPCNVAETDLTKTKGRNYSSRNMLRNSRPATSNQMAEQRETSTSHNVPEDALPSQNLDSLSSYIKLTDDSYCFTYETQDGIICLLCGKKVVEKSINHHIYSNYHIDQFKKLDLELLYEELDESSFQMSTVKAFCDSWYSSSSLTDDLVLLRNHAIIEFEGILKSINPECRLRIHGSTYYGAALQQSDVNLELIHPNSKLFDSDPRSKKSAHHILIDPDAEYGNQFNQHTMDYDLAPNPVETLYKIHRIITDSSRSLTSYPFTVTSSLSKLNQNIPNITLSHRITNTTLNVTCYSERRFNLAQLLRVYLLLDSRAEQLSTLVKIWANACGIDNPDRGSYPPHAYVIMMIYFLQRSEPPVLPCLHDLSCSPSVKTSDQPIDGHENDEDRSEEGVEKINEVREDDLEDDEEDILTASLDQNFLKDLDWKSENKSPVHVLFMQFLKTMTDELSATANVITIRTLKKQSSLFAPHSKAIIHPIHPGTNISRCIASMKTFEYIKDCFFHSYFYLSSLPVDQNIKPRNIIKSDPRDYISLYVNARRLDSYRAMKEPSIGKANYNPIMQMVQQKLFARDVETLYALSTRIHVNLSQTLANLFDLGYMRPQNITYSYSCHLCRATGHWREKCPKARIETLHQETTTYDSSLDASANFDSELMKLYQKEAISSQLSSEHNRILGSLKRIINEALDLNLNFVLYGSTVNNLGSCESDLDICVTVKDNPTGKDVDCVNILKSILDVLRTITEVHQIQPVFSARVPIIRFKYNDFDIDMSMYNQCAIYNSKLLKAYSMINPKVAPLCSLVKKFAKACGIADASRGSLSSYAWSLLVIYYLQRLDPPILPVLQEPVDSPVRGCFGVSGWNVWFHDKPVRMPEHPYSLTQLLKGFFLFYGVFDFENSVVAIRKSTQITKFHKSWNGCMIAIEDPFELTYNLANRLSDQMATFIMNSFAQTYKHIVKVQKIEIDTNGELRRSQTKLFRYLFDGMGITKVGPPLRGCLFCHKIGHKVKDCPEKNNNSRRSPRKDSGKAFHIGKWKR